MTLNFSSALAYNLRMADESHLKLRLIADNAKPEKTKRTPRRAPKVAPYCPECKSSTWVEGNEGRADYGKNMTNKVRICAYCMSKGKVTTW